MQKKSHQRILVIGASGDLGFALIDLLSQQDIFLGFHYFKNKSRLAALKDKFTKGRLAVIKGDVTTQQSAYRVIDEFVQSAGGIDALVQLSGAVSQPRMWHELDQKDWDQDLAVNLTGPFYLAQRAMKYMKANGGKIILTSTASAVHGGGHNSIAYGTAKAGIECITKGLARAGAKDHILVNAIAPGFIQTKFHKDQMKRNDLEIKERLKLIPLKRAGQPREIAGMIAHLLSDYGNYITGEVITISGGDWL